MVGILKVYDPGFGSGSINQSHGFADQDPDPDPHQNAMDPQHWKKERKKWHWMMKERLMAVFVLYSPVSQSYVSAGND